MPENDKPPEQQPVPQVPVEPHYLVPQTLLAAIVEIMQTLPYNQVKNIMPALATCQQVTPKGEEG